MTTQQCTWADLPVTVRPERISALADEAFDRLIAAQRCWYGGWKRWQGYRPGEYGYDQSMREQVLLDQELEDAQAAYKPFCQHVHTQPYQTGSVRWCAGEVIDDTRDATICTDCGSVID